METLIQTMPGYRLNEYMLVLSPHEELRKKILGVKKDFSEKYQMSAGDLGQSPICCWPGSPSLK